MSKDPHLCPRAGWLVPGTPHPGKLHSLQCSRQKVRQAPQTLIPPPPLGQGVLCRPPRSKMRAARIEPALEWKGVGEGGTSTPRWGAPTLHARTQRTKLSFPLHRQMTTSSEYSGLQTKRMFMVYRNLSARSETCCLDDLLHSESCTLLFAHVGIVSI